MGFLEAALSFPTVLFSCALLVVIGYWVLVLFGASDLEVFDADTSTVGLGGVPVTVLASLMIVVGWFASLAGTVLLGEAGLPGVLSLAVLLLALAAAWLVARLLVLPLRRVFAGGPEASRTDFVGRTCVVRTGRVGADFGQAEVTAADGSSAIVQVRQAGADPLTAGSTALIYDYDPDGEYFWIAALPQGVE
jgi:hypothetical protein